jgi:hypothetical protein
MTMLIQTVWHELLDRRSDWLLENMDEAVRWREKLIERARLQNLAFFSDMCREAKRERAVLAEKYANALHADLHLMSEVNTTYDIRELLGIARLPGKGEEHVRRRFEAMSIFDQGCLLGAIDTADSFRAISADLRRLLGEFNTRLFADRSRHVTFTLAINPENAYRVERIALEEEGIGSVPDGWLVREEKRFCRVLKGGSFACVDDRPKTPYETYLKTLRRSEGKKDDPFAIGDKCGLMLIVPGEREPLALHKRLADLFISMDGRVVESEENLTKDGPPDPRNPHSSDRYKVAKLLVEWNERRYEIQIPSFQDYFSSLYSTDRENHAMYKLKTRLDVYFPILFPSSIYGHPWDDPRLREDLEMDKRDQLERFAKRKRRY